jgi:light-regulated signal transduction histidine kinase (bacteriophytochrome)
MAPVTPLASSNTLGSGVPDKPGLDLTACDREPIHIPGAIQPHGLLLIADVSSQRVLAGAGDLEAHFGDAWLGMPLAELLDQKVDVSTLVAGTLVGRPVAMRPITSRGTVIDVTLHRAGEHLLAELEPREAPSLSADALLTRLDGFAAAFERAADLASLCQSAAAAFRDLTGFERVMIYRFLDDNAGMVLAEDRDPALHSFLNHHFPASDIPQQARALYVRNRVRVIPDVGYAPQPIRPGEGGLSSIDLSDVQLRSVSPIHIQYLANMGVGASASVSIVKDGLLWGLVACHNGTRRTIAPEVRLACQALAGGLARQIRAKEEAESYRERIRLRSAEEQLIARLDPQSAPARWFEDHIELFRQMIDADGFAVLRGQQVVSSGVCPPPHQIKALVAWAKAEQTADPFATNVLGTLYPPARDYADVGSGMLVTTLPGEGTTLLWFRAEEPQVVEWAGNPHKATLGDAGVLRPRSSFEAWREELRGHSRRWTLGEIDVVGRLRRDVSELRRSRKLVELNRELQETVAEKESLLAEKDHLLREVNHRVQNSLQLVQAFLALQAKSAEDAALSAHLDEAQRRLSAVALVHRRLYQGDQVETIDLSRYLEDLITDTVSALGAEWRANLRLDLAPVLISADRAVNVGLILTELVINANKYAYEGRPGPLAISLEEHRASFRLIVADQGAGKIRGRVGFGTRMMDAMVQRLGGAIEQTDNQPGLRVIVTAPIAAS